MRSSGEGAAVGAGRGSAVARAPAHARSIEPATRPQHARLSEGFSDVVRSIGPWSFVESVNTLTWLAPGEFFEGDAAAWNDASEYGNHFVAFGSHMPTLVPDWLDGNPGVQFDGAENILWRPNLRGFAKGSKPCAIIVTTGDSDPPNAAGTVFIASRGNDFATETSRYFLCQHRTDRIISQAHIGSAATLSNARHDSAAYLDDQPHWMLAVSSGPTDRARIYFDGALRATASTGDSGGLEATLTQMTIGGGLRDASDDLTNSYKGTIGEVIMFDGLPTAQEFTDLFAGLLAPRWPSLSWSLP